MNKITVHMTKETLYDFLLFHAYSKFGGFLTNILGFAVIFLGITMYVTDRASVLQLVIYLVAAVLFLGYTPFLLKTRAKKLVENDPQYSGPVEYTFSDEEGITTEWEGGSREFRWEEIKRAVVTPKTIGIYYEDERALIIPKQDFGDQFVPIFQMVGQHLGMNNVRMR